MTKTRAEIQKAYRERKKAKEGEDYLRKERERRMKYYIPSSELSNAARKKRNEANRLALKRYRMRRSLERQQANLSNETVNTSGYDTGVEINPGPSTSTPLRVKMDFSSLARSSGGRKRVSNALGRARKEISILKECQKNMTRKYKTLQRQVQRQRKSKLSGSPKTPRSKTEALLRSANLTSSQRDAVRKQVLTANVLMQEMQESQKNSKSWHEKKNLYRIMTGKIIKKVPCPNIY